LKRIAGQVAALDGEDHDPAEDGQDRADRDGAERSFAVVGLLGVEPASEFLDDILG